MRSTEKIKKLIGNLNLDVYTNSEADQRVLSELLQAQEKSHQTEPVFASPRIRRKTMFSGKRTWKVTALVAAVIGIVSLIILWVIGYLSEYGDGWFYEALRYIGTYDHWASFTKGIVDTRDVIYYLSFTALLLFITVRNVESRKWR